MTIMKRVREVFVAQKFKKENIIPALEAEFDIEIPDNADVSSVFKATRYLERNKP